MTYDSFSGNTAAHGIADEHRRALGLSDQAHDGRHPVAHRSEGGKRVARRGQGAFGTRVAFHAFPLLRIFQSSFSAQQLEVAFALVQVEHVGAVTGRLQPLHHRIPRRGRLGETVQQDVRGLCWNRGLHSGHH